MDLRSQSRSRCDPGGRVLRRTHQTVRQREIKPKKYVNVSSNMMGRIVRCGKEGDRSAMELLCPAESIRASGCSVGATSLDHQANSRQSASYVRGRAVFPKAEITRSEATLSEQTKLRWRADVERGLIARRLTIDQGRLRHQPAQLNPPRRASAAEAQVAALKQRDSTYRITHSVLRSLVCPRSF